MGQDTGVNGQKNQQPATAIRYLAESEPNVRPPKVDTGLVNMLIALLSASVKTSSTTHPLSKQSGKN